MRVYGLLSAAVVIGFAKGNIDGEGGDGSWFNVRMVGIYRNGNSGGGGRYEFDGLDYM